MLRIFMLGVVPLVFVGLTGCVDVSVNRTGERFPAYADNCPLDFQYGGINKMMQIQSSGGYVQVGSITVVKGGDSFNEALKNHIRPEACKMGGQVVIMGQSSPGSARTNYSYASLAVFRKPG